MDEIQKKKGVPWSTSRTDEKKNKHRTHKARRQQGKRQVRRAYIEFDITIHAR